MIIDLLISIVIGLIVAFLSFFLLVKSKSHKQSQNLKKGHWLNGIICGFIFFCISLFIYTLIH